MVRAIENSRSEFAEDLILARRCAKGDEVAMRAVFDAHEPRLRALATALLGNEQDGEEIAVSTFLRFWKAAASYRGDCPLKTFLTRICLNLARDRGRRKRIKSTPLSECEAMAAWEAADEDDRATLIRQGLLALAEEEREMLTLYYMEETSYDELCRVFSISYDVLKTRLVRARKRLRQAIGDIDGTE